MATEIKPTKEYLQKFVSPLWESLDFDECKPMLIIEGKQGAYPFVIIEMQHREYGWLSPQYATTVTTFFIITLPTTVQQRITSFPKAYQVAIDSQHVYLAQPRKKPRPGDWKHRLQLAIDIANALLPADSVTAKHYVNRPTYTPVGRGHVFYAIAGLCFLFLSLWFSATGLGLIFGIIHGERLCSARSAPSDYCIGIYNTGPVTSGFILLALSLVLLIFAVFSYYRVKKRLAINKARLE